MMYYEQRLRRVESILSTTYNRNVVLVVRGGWVPFNGKNYRVDDIEALANELEASCLNPDNQSM